LSSSDNRLYRLSNFLVRDHEDGPADKTDGRRALFRCHECFNVFSEPHNLQLHLVKHQEPAAAAVPIAAVSLPPEEEKMPPRIDHLPREDFEDAPPPRPRKKVLCKKRRAVVAATLKRLKHKTIAMPARRQNSDVIMAGLSQKRPQRLATLRRVIRCESEVSDEFNSNSENEGELSNPRNGTFRRPQRECKARTKTLVAISLAEQDYEKFDLDFAKFKTDVASHLLAATTEPGEAGKQLFAVEDMAARLEAAMEKAARRVATASSSSPSEPPRPTLEDGRGKASPAVSHKKKTHRMKRDTDKKGGSLSLFP
jgi:hypothetical protein